MISILEFDAKAFYNESEANSGSKVIVLGSGTSKTFDELEPIGKTEYTVNVS
jgi:putative ABC transport system permease protein